MNERMNLLIRILGWSLAAVGLILLFLMAFGLLQSSEMEFVNLLTSSGLFITVGYLASQTSTVLSELKGIKRDLSGINDRIGKFESKFELIWTDFKKRKEI